jgi:hypothetical protein
MFRGKSADSSPVNPPEPTWISLSRMPTTSRDTGAGDGRGHRTGPTFAFRYVGVQRNPAGLTPYTAKTRLVRNSRTVNDVHHFL